MYFFECGPVCITLLVAVATINVVRSSPARGVPTLDDDGLHITNTDSEDIDSDSKRTAALNTWEGNRDDVINELLKRAFQPWGGKRSHDSNDDDKRAFQPWGGKRTFQPWGGKRAFQPWGGKRAFQPWGGKRSTLLESRDILDEKRSQFQPWGGKRSSDGISTRVADGLEDQEDYEKSASDEKRAFQPWGGKKRADDSKDKREFQAWGGKRSVDLMEDAAIKREFQAWGGKRSSSVPDESYMYTTLHSRKKRNFEPWGGKRSQRDVRAISLYSSGLLDDTDANEVVSKRQFAQFGGSSGSAAGVVWPWNSKREFNPWGGKKREFNPWGGKRSSRSTPQLMSAIRNSERMNQKWKVKRPEFSPWGGR